MGPARSGIGVALIVVATFLGGQVWAQGQMRLTVQEFFKSNHQVEVSAGTEVVWADPHFDRVWFPAGSGAPRVERGSDGLHAVFTKPGVYRGAFTVVGGHGTNDVYEMTITVTGASK
jgi:hypothetical protein